jgi:predicted GNAT family N-acyltransferase
MRVIRKTQKLIQNFLRKGGFHPDCGRYQESGIGVGGKDTVGNRNLQNISRK